MAASSMYVVLLKIKIHHKYKSTALINMWWPRNINIYIIPSIIPTKVIGIENVEENYSGWQGYSSQFKSISDDDDIILLKCRCEKETLTCKYLYKCLLSNVY